MNSAHTHKDSMLQDMRRRDKPDIGSNTENTPQIHIHSCQLLTESSKPVSFLKRLKLLFMMKQNTKIL